MGKDWDAPWKSGAGMSAPGIGERAIPWPSFGGSMPFGGANPTCAECGGRLRGERKCACLEPVWVVDGEVVDGGARGHSEAIKQKKLFQAWCVTWLKECYRVLRPGGVIKVFGATRMMHRMAAAMVEAGFILDPRHSLEGWSYGSGFPKSLNISKVLGKMAGAERTEVIGRGTAGAAFHYGNPGEGGFGTVADKAGGTPSTEWAVTAPATEEARRFDGFGTALKPAWEPFLVGRKPV